jgi:hypothetical protein
LQRFTLRGKYGGVGCGPDSREDFFSFSGGQINVKRSGGREKKLKHGDEED